VDFSENNFTVSNVCLIYSSFYQYLQFH